MAITTFPRNRQSRSQKRLLHCGINDHVHSKKCLVLRVHFRVLHRWHRRNVGFAIASSQGDWERKQEKLQTKTRCLLSTTAPRPARRMFGFFLFLLLPCSSFFDSCCFSLLAQALLLLIAPRFSSNFSFLAGSGAASQTFLRHPSFSVSSRPLAVVVSGAIPLAAAERVTLPCELRRAPAT